MREEPLPETTPLSRRITDEPFQKVPTWDYLRTGPFSREEEREYNYLMEPNPDAFKWMTNFVDYLEPTEHLFCKKTLRQAVEPAATAYNDLMSLIDDLYPDNDDDYWIEPSQNMARLQKITHELGKGAYFTIENPDYDEEECRLWHEENPSRFNQKKVVWGQATYPEGSIDDELRERLRIETNRQARHMECQMIHGKDAPECDELEKEND